MITTNQEYFANLDILQNINLPAYALLPSAEDTLKIDTKTRIVEAPEFLSIEKDHKAETLYFEVDRRVGYVDLAKTYCTIIYNNANKDAGTRYYAVPYYDITSKQGKIIFPWVLDGNISLQSGIVEFSIQFFKVDTILRGEDTAEKIISYSLNTLPAYSKVLTGIQEKEPSLQDDYKLTPTQYESLSVSIAELKQAQKLYWTILDDEFIDNQIDDSEVQQIVDNILENSELENEVLQ